jgi:sensor c-di-GMP phosphodiesterase-like protein
MPAPISNGDKAIIQQLHMLNQKLDTLQTSITAIQTAEAQWHTQSLFLQEACALGIGIVWGCVVFRLCVLSKNQRNPFW